MTNQKYSVNQHYIETVLNWIKSGEIAIPEIQRPFVWDNAKVRDLIDSLYNGYPIGYLIAWRNPDVRLKNGDISAGKKILIDGQQRVKALTTAILGRNIVNKDYKFIRIRIAYHPLEDIFEVSNTAIERDGTWLPDISKIITGEIAIHKIVREYCNKNSDVDEDFLFGKIESLRDIAKKPLGLIELYPDLDIETVTEIFIRINSQGVELSQADFAMSKISANEECNGPLLRKCIDYFSHLAVAPEFYQQLVDLDEEFRNSEYLSKVSWLKNEKEDLYDPSYSDVLRVAFTSEFNRGKLADLVSLLSGRNFEERTYEDEIVKNSFKTLRDGVLNFINETNFKRYLMIIKSSGFISPKLIRSQNTLNFGYVLYLKLKSLGYKPGNIEKYIRRWFVMSVLTGRYTASPEGMFDRDVKNIKKDNFEEYLDNVEKGELSDAFWEVSLIESMNTSVSSSPYFNVYLAAQAKENDRGFLSKEITVQDLITHRGDIHHIFPREYLKKFDLKRGRYNQIANFVYMQSEINIAIGKKSPNVYFQELVDQVNGKKTKYGAIDDKKELMKNLKVNCIPEDIFDMDIDKYDEFLVKRRKLMAEKIKKYYFSL
ncbi:MAG: hypothetical protein APR63_11990 [Desulfuromonas sp. SDB]|nr:MAG: hypothetical protein APR63_11990 [Desulfuromonas sp. SDB]